MIFPDYNRELALQLFQEGLDELNLEWKNFPPINLIFLEVGNRGHIGDFLKRQFEDCFKIEVLLEPLPWTTAFNRLSKGQFQMGIFAWIPWVDDPMYVLRMYRAKSNEINFSKWEHPEFQRLMDLGEQEMAFFQRSQYLVEAEELLSQEVPVIPLFYEPTQALVNEKLHVFYRNPSGPFNPGRGFFN